MKIIQPTQVGLVSLILNKKFSLQEENRKRTASLAIMMLQIFFIGSAQALNLSDMLKAASNEHPSIKAARDGVDAANEDVDAARRRYWPTFSASVESGSTNRAGAPTRVLRAEQMLWDFGFTAAAVKVSERAVNIADAALDAQRQSIGFQIIDAVRILQAGHGRIRVSEEMLKRLESNEAMMMRRVAGELSTNIDLDLVRSRILQGRVELTQAKSSVKVALTRLRNLTGILDIESALVEPPLIASKSQIQSRFKILTQSDWDVIANFQPAVLRALEEMRQGNERIKMKVAESRPQIYARLDQPITNQNDTGAHIGLRYSTGAGFSNFVEERALAARALALEQLAQAARIEARQAMDVDIAEFHDNDLRAQSLSAAVQGAQRVFESYERQFTAGRKTWLDLMNALREVAQNEYSLVDANAAQAAALHRLQLRVNPELIDVEVKSQPEILGMQPIADARFKENFTESVKSGQSNESNSKMQEGDGSDSSDRSEAMTSLN